MKWLILILSCLSCAAQHPLSTGAGIEWTRLASAPVGPVPYMTGLAEYWEFTSSSLTTNATVTNWIGALQGTILTNGATARQPTNSASGVGFKGSNVGLTNLPFVLGSNYTVTWFCQYTSNSLSSFNAGLSGFYNSTLNNYSVGLQFGGSGKGDFAYWAKNGNQSALGLNNFPIPFTSVMDIEFCQSNNPNGGSGNAYVWTNGLFAGTLAREGTTVTNTFLGYTPAEGQLLWVGYIQGYYIQTNTIDTLGASNIHYYRTNFLTKGASP